MRRILYLGTYERDYPRNALTIAGLRRAGFAVRELHAPVWERQADKTAGMLSWRGLLALGARLIWAYLSLGLRLAGALRRSDLVVIGYIGQVDLLVFGPWLRLARRPILFNPLVTLTDTLVEDRGLVKPGSLSARAIRLIDHAALRLADAVLVDTAENGGYLESQFGLDASSVHWLPVGADESLFRPLGRPETAPGSPLRVLFYGKMIPLHGVETIVRAAARLGDAAEFEIVGRGQLGARARALAAELGARNIRFVDWLSFEDLPERIAAADVVLGIFGSSDKAARVVPNKVYQAMATGSAIVTRDSPAIRQVLADGQSAVLVPPDDEEALAAALMGLREPGLRAALGAGARRSFAELASLDAQAARLVQVVSGLLPARAVAAVPEATE